MVFPLLLLAAYVYGRDLGRRSFSIDELYHVYAADSFNRAGTFSVPSGNLYERASPYTFVVSLSFKRLGVSEFAARVPSVVFGLLYLALYFRLVESCFGRGIAMASALLLVASPLEVYYAREARFYSLFQLSYLIVAYCFFGLFRLSGEAKASRDWQLVVKGALLTALLLAAGYLCFKMQFGVLLFLPSVALFGLLMLVHGFFGKGSASSLKFVLSAAGLVAALGVGLYLSRELVAALLRSLIYVPRWASVFAADGLFYGRVLYHQNAFLCLLVPVGVFAAVSRNAPAALYFATLFGAPCMILSCLPMKQDRFLHHVYPFGVVFISVGVVVWLGKTVAFLRQNAQASRRLAGILSLACVVTAVAGNTAFAYGRFRVSFPHTPDWKTTCASLRSRVSGGDLVVTDNPIAVLYYLGRVDCVIDENLLEISRLAGWRDSLGKWRDYQTNAVHLASVDDVAELVAGGRRLWILLGHEGSGFRNVQSFIETIGERVGDESMDKEIRVYRIGS